VGRVVSAAVETIVRHDLRSVRWYSRGS
jgi:hypothetical protein